MTPTISEVDEAFRYMEAAKVLAPLYGKACAERDNALDKIKRLEKEIEALNDARRDRA